ncbi:MAG: dephospho-CoA kinase [Planctomycetota bacterium]
MVGLVGGIGSGKSLVASMLAEMGGRVIDADGVGHAVLRRPGIIAALAERFGRGILDAEGQIDRRRLAGIAFEDPEALAALNAVVHPLMTEELAARIAALRADPAFDGPVILDAAVLLETDWHELCDVIVFVDAPREERRARVASSRGWSADELARREKNQKCLDFKRSQAHYIVRNNSSESRLRQQVRLLYQSLVA